MPCIDWCALRCRTQYDELEEEEDEAMKRRTMALSSADAPPQPPAKASSASNKVFNHCHAVIDIYVVTSPSSPLE